jgi:hypothetical protein
MVPVNEAIWVDSWEHCWAGEVPTAAKSLEMDANFSIASNEFRTGIILACSAIEAARDDLLNRVAAKASAMKTSKTDLLKHLSVGLENVVGSNLEQEQPELFKLATAFWCARGEGAHGRPVRWRLDDTDVPIEDVEFGTISDNLAQILAWIESK